MRHALHSNPLPVQKPHPPIIFGGESTPALKRVADLGDGWQPGPIPVEVFRERLNKLRTLMTERGRNMAELSISMIGSVRDLQRDREKIAALEELGVTEILLSMTGPSVEATLREIEEGARTLIR